MEYTLDWAREQVARLQGLNAGNIRVHPNGFIQLDLTEVEAGWHESHKAGHSGAMLRLHVWNPHGHELPHQKTVNEIHDHVFDMQSTVIRGILTQQCYKFIVGGEDPRTHEAYVAIYNKGADSRLAASGIRGTLREWDSYDVEEGSSPYTQSAFTLHDTYVEPNVCTVTVMEKTFVYPASTAMVICPTDTPPDNSFDRVNAAPSDYLWSAVVAALAA